MKKLIGIIFTLISALYFVKPALAVADTVTISKLDQYTTSDNFYLSYSALSDGAVSAQFYWMKEGGTWNTLGSAINAYNGQVQVTSSQLSEQTKYYFKVVINGGTASDDTSITYDHSGPSPVQNYWKERVTPETYRLHWKNPGDSDFSRVFVYRSDTTDFDANNSTKIAEVGGAPDAEVTYDVIGLDGSKEYYFALRAIDNAGNPASIVADPEVGATVVTEPTVTQGEAQNVTTPQTTTEEGTVLGERTGEEKTVNEQDNGAVVDQIKDLLNGSQEATQSTSGFWNVVTWSRIRALIAVILVIIVIKKIFFKKRK